MTDAKLSAQQVLVLHLKRLKDENESLRQRLKATNEVLAVEIHRRCVCEGKVGTWHPEVGRAQQRIQRRLAEIRREPDWTN